MDKFVSKFDFLVKYFTKDVLDKYPIDHVFFEIMNSNIADSYFSNLNEIFSCVESIFGKEACCDYTKKLISKAQGAFEVSAFNQNYTELLVMYIVLLEMKNCNIGGEYEPKSNRNQNRTEFKILLDDSNMLNVEVKVLNFENSFDKILKQAYENKSYIYKENITFSNESREKLRYKIMLEENLDINKMALYTTEFRKINNQIKEANKKFNLDDRYNILFINYNEGLDSREVIKCVLDEKQGIVNINNNMCNIDAIIVLSLSNKCYMLSELSHSKSNAFVILNPNRNVIETRQLIIKLGFNNIFETDDGINDYDIYAIVMIENIKQYVVVPYTAVNNNLAEDVLNFIAPNH